jgi:hypothetical protein
MKSPIKSSLYQENLLDSFLKADEICNLNNLYFISLDSVLVFAVSVYLLLGL